MKKIILGSFFLLPFCLSAQDIVTDMETRVTYKTNLISCEGKIGFVYTDVIVDGSELAGIGGKLYTGPAERIPTGPYGEGGMSIKICHNTSNWPCMWVRK